jgi:hypothetical protein
MLFELLVLPSARLAVLQHSIHRIVRLRVYGLVDCVGVGKQFLIPPPRLIQPPILFEKCRFIH